jgi:hypothetical protein
MGASFGGQSSQEQATTSGTSTGTAAKTFSPGQSSLQTQLGTSLSRNLTAADAGTLTPGTTAMETQAADQINKTSSGLTDRVNQFLAQRGFGKSGQTGKATLEGELGREAQLGTNAANFAGMQQGLNSQNLLAALNYAFTSLGQTTAGTTSGTYSGTGSQFGWKAGAQVPGFGPPSLG